MPSRAPRPRVLYVELSANDQAALEYLENTERDKTRSRADIIRRLLREEFTKRLGA